MEYQITINNLNSKQKCYYICPSSPTCQPWTLREPFRGSHCVLWSPRLVHSGANPTNSLRPVTGASHCNAKSSAFHNRRPPSHMVSAAPTAFPWTLASRLFKVSWFFFLFVWAFKHHSFSIQDKSLSWF